MTVRTMKSASVVNLFGIRYNYFVSNYTITRKNFVVSEKKKPRGYFFFSIIFHVDTVTES